MTQEEEEDGVVGGEDNFVFAVEEPGRRLVLQLVGRRATITPIPWPQGATPRTRIVLISRHNTVNFDAIGKALDRCRASTASPKRLR